MDQRALLAALAQLPAGPGMDEAKVAMLKLLQNPALLQNPLLQQTQQQTVQQNDNYNLIQNALASGVPTLDVPTISAYLGYGGPPVPKEEPKDLPTKYQKLLDTIEEMKRDVRPLYCGSKGATERIRRQVNQARQLVRECMNEIESSSKTNK